MSSGPATTDYDTDDYDTLFLELSDPDISGASASTLGMGPRKRRASKRDSTDAEESPSTKRRRRNARRVEEASPIPLDSSPPEKTMDKQAKKQEKPEPEKPLRLNSLTCVICMDKPTDLTATSCGHLFCHACLQEALISGEARSRMTDARRSQCPICRKTLNRHRSADVIPLLIKKGLKTQPRKAAPKASKAGSKA
ncbi:hypothetical protein EJ06DRAFT_558831 [Trichodelitschia bisporula]|uniref:RING-type domain-containing protein n=1 Tax=Trichodelitschia bisporula TaxID=703511 RepID=A0A6G1HPN5_9PEZI|nr:hypothetical protein EJ06DRAFT_558831 [Trichodelitschia bisporula]